MHLYVIHIYLYLNIIHLYLSVFLSICIHAYTYKHETRHHQQYLGLAFISGLFSQDSLGLPGQNDEQEAPPTQVQIQGAAGPNTEDIPESPQRQQVKISNFSRIYSVCDRLHGKPHQLRRLEREREWELLIKIGVNQNRTAGMIAATNCNTALI